ncbi:MAG TPA: hypothetical protein PLI57_02070 [Spirochaetota bacterium]|nr:hypothetical protein [Spirochaetota bacterium]
MTNNLLIKKNIPYVSISSTFQSAEGNEVTLSENICLICVNFFSSRNIVSHMCQIILNIICVEFLRPKKPTG